MISKISRLSTLIILLFSVEPVLSQPDVVNGYSVQHFTDENGLPQNSINDLLFDKDGYLWLASQVGLVRFNGSAFKVYYPKDKPMMESNIVSLGKNDKGIVYFQTNDHHLYCYSGNSDQYLSPVNTPAVRRPILLNGCKQLFDFSRFLQAAGAGETARRGAVFQRLFDHPENFYVADSLHVYLVDRDSLYYFDGSALQLLSPAAGRGVQLILHDRQLFVLHRDSLNGVFDQGRLIAGPAPIEGDLLTERTAGHKPAPKSVRLFSCGRANHLLV